MAASCSNCITCYTSILDPEDPHFPFSSLKKLVEFLLLWFSQGGEIKTFSLPFGIYRDAFTKLDDLKKSDALRYQELKDAVARLDDWDRSGKVRSVVALRDPTPYSLEYLHVYTLHPRQIFIEKHKGKINEISLVLRVVYGKFSVILLSDLEGEGLKDYLSVAKASSDSAIPETRANIVKIPHHGGYPANGEDLKELLAAIDAEVAILSVGSNNPYGHVVPELFKALIELQNNNDLRLEQFVCTEVTRTCIHSELARSSMGKSGLSAPQKCAGEIAILANNSGEWQLRTEAANHSGKIASLSHAACDGRADISW